MKHDSPESGTTSPTDTAGEFFNREIQRLETERDAMYRELQQIHQSYAWKMVDSYRRWMERHRDNSFIRSYEKLAVWVLDRTVGGGEQDQRQRYQLWLEARAPTPSRIASLKTEAASLPYRPLISVVLIVGSVAKETWLSAAIGSLRAQLYDNWELSILSGGSASQEVEAFLLHCAAEDSRIVIGHEARSNGDGPPALDLQNLARGEFLTFLDQSGALSPEAFFEVVKRLNRNPLDDLYYWDEDRLDSAEQRIEPFFKPEWSPDLLLSMNYLGDCFVIRTALAEKLGGLRRDFAPSQIYDLALRTVERTDKIIHIPEVLYHRRRASAASVHQLDLSPEMDRQNLRAIDEALGRRGEDAKANSIGSGLYAVRYNVRNDPLVSIVIPTRDKSHLLRQCLDSIEHSTDYKNYEIIVLDNDSSEPESLAYLKEIADNVQVQRCPGVFNFSAINNLGTKKASGEYLLFLNNDTEVIRTDWLRAMIEQAQRPEVGAVGAKLLFPDNRIQHAGAVLGIGGIVGHAFRLTAPNVRHYFGLADVIRECSAVTAACMMMRRSVFDEVDGFDEKFVVDFADIDLCLRIGQRGYRIVYTPLALLHHHESATRRRMHVPGDLDLFVSRWGACLKRGDPYYSRNLTLNREDWTIAP